MIVLIEAVINVSSPYNNRQDYKFPREEAVARTAKGRANF
jgi:hypothetical protein